MKHGPVEDVYIDRLLSLMSKYSKRLQLMQTTSDKSLGQTTEVLNSLNGFEDILPYLNSLNTVIERYKGSKRFLAISDYPAAPQLNQLSNRQATRRQ